MSTVERTELNSVRQSEKLTISNLLDECKDDSTAARMLRVGLQGGHAALHSAIQAPITGLTELVDHTFDSNLSAHTKILSTPSRADSVAEAIAQQVGSLVGTIAPLLLVHKGVRGVGNRCFGSIESSLPPARRLLGEAAATGAVFEGVFRPDEKSDTNTFAQHRFANAINGAATFTVLTGGALALKHLSTLDKVKSFGALSTIIGSDVGSMSLTGLPAGFVHSELNSLLKTGTFASGQDVVSSMAGFAALGGAFAGAGRMFTRPSYSFPETTRSTRQAERMSMMEQMLEDAVPETRLQEGLGSYCEALRKGKSSAESTAVRAKYADEPGFGDLAKEAEQLQEGLARKSPNKLDLGWNDSPADPRLGEALSSYAELMANHGPKSRQAEAFFRQNRSIPEFSELARECQRLELLYHRQGSSPQFFRLQLPSRDSVPLLIAGSSRNLQR